MLNLLQPDLVIIPNAMAKKILNSKSSFSEEAYILLYQSLLNIHERKHVVVKMNTRYAIANIYDLGQQAHQ